MGGGAGVMWWLIPAVWTVNVWALMALYYRVRQEGGRFESIFGGYLVGAAVGMPAWILWGVLT